MGSLRSMRDTFVKYPYDPVKETTDSQAFMVPLNLIGRKDA